MGGAFERVVFGSEHACSRMRSPSPGADWNAPALAAGSTDAQGIPNEPIVQHKHRNYEQGKHHGYRDNLQRQAAVALAAHDLQAAHPADSCTESRSSAPKTEHQNRRQARRVAHIGKQAPDDEHEAVVGHGDELTAEPIATQQRRHEDAGGHSDDDGIVQATHIELAAHEAHYGEQDRSDHARAEDDKRALVIEGGDRRVGHREAAGNAYDDGEDRHRYEQANEEPLEHPRALGPHCRSDARILGIRQRGQHGKRGERGREPHPHRIGKPHGDEIDHHGEDEGGCRVHGRLAGRHLRVNHAESQHDCRRADAGQRRAGDEEGVALDAQTRRGIRAHRSQPHHHGDDAQGAIARHHPAGGIASEGQRDERQAQGQRGHQIGERQGVGRQIVGCRGRHEHVAVVGDPNPGVVEAEAHKFERGPLLLDSHAEARRREFAARGESLLIIAEPFEHLPSQRPAAGRPPGRNRTRVGGR